ncbi:hypothetical protein [Faecalispora jeddahensis]|nr:hypothetical protein [Faecalispora jeddahensis]
MKVKKISKISTALGEAFEKSLPYGKQTGHLLGMPLGNCLFSDQSATKGL